ncbi:MAG: hypothetical protein WBM07_17120 [Chitinivibrionales bacterium]
MDNTKIKSPGPAASSSIARIRAIGGEKTTKNAIFLQGVKFSKSARDVKYRETEGFFKNGKY